MIKGSLLCSIPIVKRFGRKFLSPKMGRKFEVLGVRMGKNLTLTIRPPRKSINIETRHLAQKQCFCARWRVSVEIDFLGGLIVRVKIFPILKISDHFWTFRPQRFTMGTLQSKLPLLIIVAREGCIVNRQIGVKVSKFLVVAGPLLIYRSRDTAHAQWPFLVYITLLNIIMAVKQEIVNADTSNLSHC